MALRYKFVLNLKSFLITLLLLPGVLVAQTIGPTYRFHTNLGDIDVMLTPAAAPNTVTNFINYVNAGAYVNSIIHRSVPGFVIQGGGFQLQSGSVIATPTVAPVVNEFNVSNTRGTIAMAKLGTDPNSATSQWFFNLADNGSQLDGQNGGFTVFGKITNTAGLAVMDKIAALATVDESTTVNTAFTNLPVSNGNFVLVTSIVPVPAITSASLTSAASFAASSATGISPGEMIAIFGQAIGPTDPVSFTVTNGALSTTLGGVQVLFNGKPAPIVYASSTQVNVIAPYSFSFLPTVDVAVSYQGATTSALTYRVQPENPALFTQNFGTGDAAIRRLDGTIVNAASPASPGDVLELFGEGYGLATSATTLPDGAIITGATLPVPNDPTTLLLIDGQSVPWLYFGGAIINGVLQVNFTVPQLKAGAHQIQIQVGNRTSPTGVTLVTK